MKQQRINIMKWERKANFMRPPNVQQHQQQQQEADMKPPIPNPNAENEVKS